MNTRLKSTERFFTRCRQALVRRPKARVAPAHDTRCSIEPLEARIAPAVILNGGGKGYVGNGSGGPPDVTGAAGPNSYLEITNNTVTLFSPKLGGAILAQHGISDFFYNAAIGNETKIDAGSCGVCDSTGAFDNLMGTDGRFIIGDIDVDMTTNVSQYIFAVSKSSNPTTFTTADWNFYHITTTRGSGASQAWTDYPGNPGFNADSFVETFNMAQGNGLTGNAEVVTINSADLAAGVPQASLHFYNSDISGSNSYRATAMHDAVAGDPMWLIRNPNDGTHIEVTRVDNVLSNSPTLTATSLTLPASKNFSPSGINNPLNSDHTVMIDGDVDEDENNPGNSPASDVDNRILNGGEYNKTIVAAHKAAVGTASVVSATIQPPSMGNPTPGGTGYTVGDTLTLTGGTFTTADTLKVATLGAGGSVASVTIANPGTYSSLSGISGTVTGGTGSGATFSVNFSGELDVQWYAIDVSGATPAFQKVGGVDNVGRVGFGPNTYAVEPAIDINSSGQIGLGFMESDTLGGAANAATAGFISTFVTARFANDAAGTMQPSLLVSAGTGTGTITGRIGDFSGMNVDPVNGTFWHVNEFGGGGPTDIANFAPAFTLDATHENVTIRVNPADSTMNQVLLTGTNTVLKTFPNDSPMLFVVAGDANNNSVTVDESFGVVNTPLLFDGGSSPGAPGDHMSVIGTGGDDTLNLTPSGMNSGTSADLTFDSSRVYSFRNIQQFSFKAGDGHDDLTVDSSTSLLNLANGVHFDGGTGHDALQLLQTGGSQTGDVYSIGPNNGDGSSVITGAGGTQTVEFQNIEPVLDLVPAALLLVNATPANNAINYSKGSVVANGLVTLDNFESIEFSNKTALTLNGLEGSDQISIHNDAVPTALTGITINGGDPTGSDQLIVTGTSAVDAFTFAGLSPSAGDVTGVVAPIHFTGIEHVLLDGQAGDDVFNLKGDNGAVSLLGGAGADRLSFATATQGVVFDLDALNVAQRVTTSDATVTVLDHLEKFTGSGFNDILRVEAVTFARDLNGGLPNAGPTVPPGDTLIFDGQGAVVTVLKTDANTGTIKTKGYADVTYDEFETTAITNSPSGPGGFGPPGSNSNAFTAAHIDDPTTFTSGGQRAPGRGPQGIATGDFNGDGFADLVVANSKTKNITVFLNDGDGTFGEPTNFTAGSAPQDVVTGDFNGDAKIDIVVTDHGSGDVALFLGNGAGLFAAPTFTKLGAAPGTMATADLNGDTFPDLVVAMPGLGAVNVLLGNGAGGFSAPVKFKTGGRTPYDVVIGDFNADTKLDVVTANYGSNNIGFLAGNGAGSFGTATTFKTGVHPTGVAAGDINNDGVLDIAASNQPGAYVSVLLSNGAVPAATQFQPQLRVALPKHHAPFSIAIADLDGNGIADLALGNAINTSITVLLGTGLGKFTQPYEFELGTFPKAPRTGGLTLVDLNNDGLLDIASTSTNTDDTRVFIRNV